MFDYHMHTKISFDSNAEPLDMLRAAQAAGMREICFTEHYDIHPLRPGEIAPPDLQQYRDNIQLLRGQNSPVAVKMGIELGVTRELISEYKKIAEEFPCDFVICSQHFIHGEDPYDDGFFDMYPDWQEDYLSAILSSITEFDSYSVVGHIGYPGKYCGQVMRYAERSDLFDAILKKVISSGKGIEINTSSLSALGEFVPASCILSRYLELGGEIITLGSDAHTPSRVGANILDAVELLRSLKFKYVCTFSNMQPTFHKI